MAKVRLVTDHRIRTLDYFCEYPLGSAPSRRQRNVPLRFTAVGAGSFIPQELQDNFLCWRLARWIEGRDDALDSDGVWPINYFRCEKRFGDPGILFPMGSKLSAATEEVYAEAKKIRILCYHRLADSIEAMELLRLGRDQVRYATEITADWYYCPDGQVPFNPDAEIRGSHGVPITVIEYSTGEPRFAFQNSWGLWGANGLGAISLPHFDHFMIEAWDPAWGYPPITAKSGIVCVEWKWSISDKLGIHGREIIEAGTDERLAWAFCKRRSEFLDVEEFFVWPSERRKGCGRQLAKMVRQLATEMKLPLRLLVSYADSETDNKDNLDAAARLLGVNLVESGEKWTHLFGVTNPVHRDPIRPRPIRPANTVEALRPRDEKPVETPIDYVVFFGTNRALVDPDDVLHGFSGARDSTLHLGRVIVRIPMTPRFGTKGTIFNRIWTRILGLHPELLKPVRFSNEEELGEQLAMLAKDWADPIHNILYVHGFKTTFEDAAIQTARFGVDLKIPGNAFCFSWPSTGKLVNYSADEATVEASLKYLLEYIGILLRQTGTAPLSIIVHSMGNRVVINALKSLAGSMPPEFAGRIKHVVLAAPDVDSDVFKQLATDFLSVPQKTTLYVARGDFPLASSEKKHKYPRAGFAPPIIVLPKMDTVLVEGFDMLSLGHDYYATADRVIEDLFHLLHFDSEPCRRRNPSAVQTEAGENYWKITI